MRLTISFCIIILACCLSTVALGQMNFEDISASSGIDSVGTARGISFGDYNNDGYDDIYFSYSSDQPNILFKNNGDLTFEDVTEAAGVGNAFSGNCSVWGDFDNDGDEDLYVGNLGDPNVLYRNEGDGTFTDITEEMGVGTDLNTRSVHFVDLNHDGWLDLYVHNINDVNQHYLNEEGTGFTNVVDLVGTQDTQVAQGAVCFDFDNDGDQDLYLTHDANQECIMYQNDGTGNFVDVAPQYNLDLELNAMGVDFADINNDGFFDVYVTNLGINALMVYDIESGDYSFETFDAGPEGNGMSWGTFFFDGDNDGFEDIYVCNDSFFAPLPNFLYKNMGDGTFTAILEEHPMSGFEASWGGATADLDRDGRLEVVIANANAIGNQLFLNTTPDAGNWLGMELEGTISNRSAIGTRVTVYAGEMQRMDEVAGGSGFASQHSTMLHFGIGDEMAIDSAVVSWPSGLSETYYDVSPGMYHVWVEGESLVMVDDPFITLESQDLENGDEVKDEPDSDVSVSNPVEKQSMLFPNPAGERATVTWGGVFESLELYGLDGALLRSIEVKGKSSISLQLDALPAGEYVVLLIGDQKTDRLRFQKQ